MGKATGFMEYTRTENTARDPRERAKDYGEFHLPLTGETRREQAARCMDCGAPFCQNGQPLCGMISGCPLNNLIPEWNELIYRGRPELALRRLLITNPFPEFTSRVCPALCEKACICGLNDEPVTVRDNEQFIIEYGFSKGLMAPRSPRVLTGKRVSIVGSGPAGLAAADMLAGRGHRVTVYERSDRPGGLLMYGIPNMKLDKAVVERRISLMEEEGVKFVLNADVGRDISAEELLEESDAVILACGASKPRDISAPGRDAEGVRFAVDYLTESTKALMEGRLPHTAEGLEVVVIGGGDTGNDCVGTAIRQGCTAVTQLEMMPRLPEERAEDNPFPEWPRVLKTDYGQEEAAAVFGQDPRVYCTTVKEFLKDENGRLRGVTTVKLDFSAGKPRELEGSEEFIPCQLCLIAAGFLGAEEYVPEAFGLELTGRNNVVTEKDNLAGGKVFTAGDMYIGQSLVVRAIKEGRDAARQVDEFLCGYSNL